MFFKSIVLNIVCSKTPCKLTVLSCDDKIIEEFVAQSYFSKFCIRTKRQTIKLIAQYENHTICQTIRLCNKLCQTACLSFSFDTILPQKQLVFVNLSDATYGFPIKNAILNFKKSTP
jgi:hypothetical protein